MNSPGGYAERMGVNSSGGYAERIGGGEQLQLLLTPVHSRTRVSGPFLSADS